jgi:hypothetical protein
MHATCPTHPILLDLICIMVLGMSKIMMFPIVQLSPFSCYFFPLGSKYSPQHPVLLTPSVHSVPLMWQTKCRTHTKQLAELWFCVF